MKFLIMLLVAIGLTFAPMTVLAQDDDDCAAVEVLADDDCADVLPIEVEVQGEGDVVGLVGKIVQSAQSKNWSLLTGAIILILVWAFNYVVLRFVTMPTWWPKALPWVSMAIGLLSQFGLALLAGEGWAQALNTGVQVGLLASGSWSALGKYFLPKPEAKS